MREQSRYGTRLIANPQFWSVITIFIFITLHHYDDQTAVTIFSLPDLPLGITRHTIDRILYLVPIILSSMIFGPRIGLIMVAMAFLSMLPRAVLISTFPMTALWETLIITLIGSLAPLGLDHYKKQEAQLEVTKEKLEYTQKELDSKVQISIEQEKQLAVINSFSAMLSQTLELNHVMNTTIDMVSGLLQAEIVLVFSLDSDAEKLRLLAFKGIREKTATLIEELDLDGSLCGMVARTGQPLLIEDKSKDSRLSRLSIVEEDLQVELSVPLVAHGKIMGALYIATGSKQSLRERDIELLSALGNLVGVAMRNARLYKDREIAIEQLKLSEKKYRQLFENAHDAIWVQDLSGKVIAANDAVAELFGYGLTSIIGSNSEALFTSESQILFKGIMNDLLRGSREEQPYVQEIVRSDGRKAIIMLTANLISSEGQPDGIQFIGRDITREVRMQENQSFYLQQITRAHEEERQRISRDLHDSTAQSLIAILRSLERFCEDEQMLPDDRLNLLWNYHGQLRGVLQEIRQLSRDLRPSVIDQLGLLPSVEWLVEQFKVENEKQASFSVVGNERRFTPEIEVTLFRIVQEALRNIARHAGATSAEVLVNFKSKETVITITDDGQGFDLPLSLGEFSRHGKLGIDGMQTRARLVGGTLDVSSGIGKGTIIRLVVPA